MPPKQMDHKCKMAIDWSDFVDLVHAHQRFLLTSHIRPDCDALGSELGMAEVLESLGKDVLIVNAQTTPPNLSFLDPQRRIRVLGTDIQAVDLQDRQVLIILDTSAWAQLGDDGRSRQVHTCPQGRTRSPRE